MQTKFSKVENCVRFDTFMITRSQTAREMYVDSQMGIITSTASPGQASVPEDMKKTSSEDKTPQARGCLAGPVNFIYGRV